MASCIFCSYRRGSDCLVGHKLEGHCQDMGNGLWLSCHHYREWLDNIPHNPEHEFPPDDVIETMDLEAKNCGCHTMQPQINQSIRADLECMKKNEPLFFAVHYHNSFQEWFLMAIYKTPMHNPDPTRAHLTRGRYHYYHPIVRLDMMQHTSPHFNLAREVIQARTGNQCPHRIKPHMSLDEGGEQWQENKDAWVCILESSCNFGDQCTEDDYKYCYLDPKKENSEDE